jgi:short-subunit dehydrogenase
MSATVLVTGASSGIGAAVARKLQASGFTVFGTTRKANPEQRDGFKMLALDVNSDESARACVDEVLSQSGRLDVLVNNAGFALVAAAEETSITEAKEQFETNFFGVVRMTKAVLPAMHQAERGWIINIGSLAGLMAIPFNAFYCGTKFALEAYSEALWYELKPFGIAVSLIEPGFVNTPISQSSRTALNPLKQYDTVRTRAGEALARSVKEGVAPALVADAVWRAATAREPQLRYRVGGAARWLPRLRNAAPWKFFASGVRRTFALDASGS